MLIVSVLECVNGDYDDHTEALAEGAKDTRWRYDQQLMQGDTPDPPSETQVAKFNESQSPDSRSRRSTKSRSSAWNRPKT